MGIYYNWRVFEWDDANLRKLVPHGLTRDEVESAFLDPFVMDRGAQEVEGETRWVLFGMTDTGTIIRIIYTERAERIRVITAHTATRGQASLYDRHRSELLKG